MEDRRSSSSSSSIGGVLVVVAALRPTSLRSSAAPAIKATPDKIYPLLADFRQWPAWSPWEKLDPEMKRTLSGPAERPGATLRLGRLEQGRRRPDGDQGGRAPSKVVIQLDFIKPFEGHNIADFTLAPRGDDHRGARG